MWSALSRWIVIALPLGSWIAMSRPLALYCSSVPFFLRWPIRIGWLHVTAEDQGAAELREGRAGIGNQPQAVRGHRAGPRLLPLIGAGRRGGTGIEVVKLHFGARLRPEIVRQAELRHRLGWNRAAGFEEVHEIDRPRIDVWERRPRSWERNPVRR